MAGSSRPSAVAESSKGDGQRSGGRAAASLTSQPHPVHPQGPFIMAIQTGSAGGIAPTSNHSPPFTSEGRKICWWWARVPSAAWLGVGIQTRTRKRTKQNSLISLLLCVSQNLHNGSRRCFCHYDWPHGRACVFHAVSTLGIAPLGEFSIHFGHFCLVLSGLVLPCLRLASLAGAGFCPSFSRTC